MKKIYQTPLPRWDATKCEKAAKRVVRNGLGTPHYWPGYIGNHYGEVRYNGGCERNGKWYAGEHFPLPLVTPGYKIIRVPTLGYRIIKVETD